VDPQQTSSITGKMDLRRLLELACEHDTRLQPVLEALASAFEERAEAVLAERVAALAEKVARLRAEVVTLATQADQASAAHDRLRDHHADVLVRLAAELRAIATLSPLQYRQARRRIEGLVALLEKAAP